MEHGEERRGPFPLVGRAAVIAQDLVNPGFRLLAQPILVDLVGMAGLGILGKAVKGEFCKVGEVEGGLQRDLVLLLRGCGGDASQRRRSGGEIALQLANFVEVVKPAIGFVRREFGAAELANTKAPSNLPAPVGDGTTDPIGCR